MPDAPTYPSEQAAIDADRKSSAADRVSATADVVASSRDDAAMGRELVSELRDRAATARDRAAEEREFADGPGGPGYASGVIQAADVRAHASADRELAAADRGRATLDRAEAVADRARAASDRQHAAMDREHAAVDRREARAELKRAHTDALTGAYRRGAGVVALQVELDRAQRSGEGLVIAFVDVDGLKATNDRDGHAAGDARLRAVANAMRSRLRSYEPVVRYGGDEFLCSIAGVGLPGVRTRFDKMSAALRHGDFPGSMSVGLAEMRVDETLDDLINRADDALAEARGRVAES